MEEFGPKGKQTLSFTRSSIFEKGRNLIGKSLFDPVVPIWCA